MANYNSDKLTPRGKRGSQGKFHSKGASARAARRFKENSPKWRDVDVKNPWQTTKQAPKTPQIMINVNTAHHETTTNKNTGMFRIVDSQSGKVTPELVNLFNSKEARKRLEGEIRKTDKSMYEYLKSWQIPYGYPSWPWVFFWLTRIRNESFQKQIPHVALSNLIKGKREDCLEEVHLIGDQMMEDKAEPICLTRDMAQDFIRTDIPSFDADQNEVLSSFIIMLPKNVLTMVTVDDNNQETQSDTRAILVVTNNRYRQGLRTHYNEFLKALNQKDLNANGYLGSKEGLQKKVDAKLDPINYMDDEKDGYMFKSGFKLLALDSKCGGHFMDFTWEDGTKDFKIYRPEDERSILQSQKHLEAGERFKAKHVDKIVHLDGRSDYYRSLINIVANTILTMSHHTEYVSVKSPLIGRGVGSIGQGDEVAPRPTTWIGENYNSEKTRYEYPDDHVPSKGVSPRAHWRRGHQRYVCQGPGRKQKVLKWIKPCYVNGNKD